MTAFEAPTAREFLIARGYRWCGIWPIAWVNRPSWRTMIDPWWAQYRRRYDRKRRAAKRLSQSQSPIPKHQHREEKIA